MVKLYFSASRQFKERVLESAELLGKLTIFFYRSQVPGIFDHMFLLKLAKILLKSQKKVEHFSKKPSSGQVHHVQRFQAFETFETFI